MSLTRNASAAPLKATFPAGSTERDTAPSTCPCSSTMPSPQTMTTFFCKSYKYFTRSISSSMLSGHSGIRMMSGCPYAVPRAMYPDCRPMTSTMAIRRWLSAVVRTRSTP